MVNVKYFAVFPPSSALPFIGLPGHHTWFADASGQWIAGGSVPTPPTSAEFAVLAMVSGTSPDGVKLIDTIPVAQDKNPFPPPPPDLAPGTPYATYEASFSTTIIRDFDDAMTFVPPAAAESA